MAEPEPTRGHVGYASSPGPPGSTPTAGAGRRPAIFAAGAVADGKAALSTPDPPATSTVHQNARADPHMVPCMTSPPTPRAKYPPWLRPACRCMMPAPGPVIADARPHSLSPTRLWASGEGSKRGPRGCVSGIQGGCELPSCHGRYVCCGACRRDALMCACRHATHRFAGVKERLAGKSGMYYIPINNKLIIE